MCSICLILQRLRARSSGIINELEAVTQENNSTLMVLSNKADIHPWKTVDEAVLAISAKEKLHLDELERIGCSAFSANESDVIISNIRHLEALKKTEDSLHQVLGGIDDPVTSDFLALDIKQALYYLGEITGQVTTDDLLDNIFSKFCIGK